MAKRMEAIKLLADKDVERVRLSDVADVIRGVTYKKDDATAKPATGLVAILRANNIQDRRLITDEELVFVPKDLVGSEQLLRKGDVVIATSSGSKDLVGKAAPLREDWRGSFGAFCAAVRPKEDIEPLYLAHFFESPEYKDLIRKKALGVNINNLRRGDLEDLKIPLAPLPEQRRIVSAIETQLGRLDAAVASLHAAKAKLKRYKQAVLKAAYCGEMTAEWRSNAQLTPVDDMLSRIETPPRPSRYNTRSTDVVDGDYALAIGAPERQGPQGWKWVPLVDIARLESGHTPSKRHPEYWDGDIPWIELRDARDRHGATIHTTNHHTNQLGLDNSAARLLPEGTICLSRTASVGYVVKMGSPMCTSQDFVNWVCTEAIDPDWLMLLFVAENDAIWRFGKGTTHTTVYFPEVVSFHVLLPPIEEQREIVRRARTTLEATAETESTLDAQLQQASRLRQSVLKRAFEGRLV